MPALHATTVHARDIMKTYVVQLDPRMPIEEAIETLEEHDISGAPVVDENGLLVGILSARDVTRSEHVRSSRIEANRGEFVLSGPVDEEGEYDDASAEILDRDDYSPALAGAETVAGWMSRRAVTVGPDTSLREVCRTMVKEHVHRVVVAREKRVVGIVTSLDLVAWLAERR